MIRLGLSLGSGLSFERAEVRSWICNGVVANGYNANGRDGGMAGNERKFALYQWQGWCGLYNQSELYSLGWATLAPIWILSLEAMT